MNGLARYWFGATSPLPLAAFRIAFVIALLVYFSDRLLYAEESLVQTATLLQDIGQVDDTALQHLQPWRMAAPSRLVVGALIAAFYVVSFGLLFGVYSRTAAFLLGLWLLYATLLDWLGSFSLNRSAILICFAMSAMPIGAVGSWDARRRRRVEQTISAWPVRTLQWFLLLWYMASGVAKIRGGWLVADDVLWTQLQGWYQTPIAVLFLRVVPLELVTVLQYGVLIFEVLAPLWLVPRRLRPFGMTIGVLMHIGLALLMGKLWMFSLYVLAFYPLFVDVRPTTARQEEKQV